MPLRYEEERASRAYDTLSKDDPLLTPDKLGRYFPEYKKFTPLSEAPQIWVSEKFLRKREVFPALNRKLILLLSGISAAGKDALWNEINKRNPGLFRKVVTTTSRSARSGEQEGVDYYFKRSLDEFNEAETRQEFLETIEPQPGRKYGTTSLAFVDALSDEQPVTVSLIDILGWKNLSNYLDQYNVTNDEFLYPLVTKFFVLPERKFSDYVQFLRGERPPEEFQKRIYRSAWEIEQAANYADVFVVNRFSDNPAVLRATAEALVNELGCLLSHETINVYMAYFRNLMEAEQV
jgi:guanylate kinase